MKVAIYDENNLYFTLATACYASIKRVKVFEAKEVNKDFPEGKIDFVKCISRYLSQTRKGLG